MYLYKSGLLSDAFNTAKTTKKKTHKYILHVQENSEDPDRSLQLTWTQLHLYKLTNINPYYIKFTSFPLY